jgi:hypothetical protein
VTLTTSTGTAVVYKTEPLNMEVDLFRKVFLPEWVGSSDASSTGGKDTKGKNDEK